MIFLFLNKSKTVYVFALFSCSIFLEMSANSSIFNTGFLLILAILFKAVNAFYLSYKYKYRGLSTNNKSPKDKITQGIQKK